MRKNAHLIKDENLQNLANRLLRENNCDVRIAVCWNPKLRSTAGLADWSKKTITLNPKLKEFGKKEINRTFLHELAHILAQCRMGRRHFSAHGPEWRQACVDLGIPNETRCHNLPIKKVQQTRKFFYLCSNCNNKLARVRKTKRKIACLKCCRTYNNGAYHPDFRFVSVTKEKFNRVHESNQIAA